MKILVINAGSSSIKYQLIDADKQLLMAKGLVERIGISGSRLEHKVNGKVTEISRDLKNHEEGMNLVLKTLVDKGIGVVKSLSEINGFGHRFVHGGEYYTKTVVANAEILKKLEDLSELAPLHNPANIQGIKACMAALPSVPNVLMFDTAFHSTLPEKAYMYGVPYSWYKDYGIRRYGFHGISHCYIMQETAKVMGKDAKDLKIITCHIGNGASVDAVKYGKAIDTSMGLTPLEGLIMGSRSGDIDATIVDFMGRKLGVDSARIIDKLNKESGLLGISGISNDIRDIQAAVKNGNKRAALAIEMFCYRIKKYIGSYAAALGGIDALVFTAGTGENRPEIRESIASDMEYMGIELDKKANNEFTRGEVCLISKPSSKVKVYVIPTDEEMCIAKEAQKLIQS